MNFEIICPKGATSDDHLTCTTLPPFSDEAVSFIVAFSKALFVSSTLKKYPELMALAFWMRKSRILKLKQQFDRRTNNRLFLGRGRVFHLAPANVDTLFIYSWFLSLLVGNSNSIRLSSTDNPQLGALTKILNTLLNQKQFSAIRKRTLLVRYPHDDEITTYFSKDCNVRVIWGGDATIRHIRTLPLPPTSIELPFADKFSLSVLNAEAYNNSREQEKTAENFFNDAFWFSQMACSSPRLVAWIGEQKTVTAAQKTFWSLLEARVLGKDPDISAADVMNKVVASSMMAIDHPGVHVLPARYGYIHRVALPGLEDVDEHLHCGAGLFYETRLDSLMELAPYLSRRNQTVTSFGFTRDNWQQLITTSATNGIDRIVPMGQALDFSVTWDGMDLLTAFCREISLEIE